MDVGEALFWIDRRRELAKKQDKGTPLPKRPRRR